jgi:hypothetical protein
VGDFFLKFNATYTSSRRKPEALYNSECWSSSVFALLKVAGSRLSPG